MLVAALASSWAALQPVRAAHAEDRAQDAIELGKYDLAAQRAQTAAAAQPAVARAAVAARVHRGRPRRHGRAANRYLERAVLRQPANTEAWRRLGRYRLSVLGDAEGAVEAFRAAYFLDPASIETRVGPDRGDAGPERQEVS